MKLMKLSTIAMIAISPSLSHSSTLILPSNIYDHAQIGQAYIADEAKFLPLNCIHGEIVNENNSAEAEYKSFTGSDYNSVIETLTGSVNASANFPLLGVDGYAAIANSILDSEKTYTVGTIVRLKTHERKLTPGTTSYSDYCFSITDGNYKKVGSHYVSQIVYGGGVNH